MSPDLPQDFLITLDSLAKGLDLEHHMELTEAQRTFTQAAVAFNQLNAQYPEVPMSALWHHLADLCLIRSKFYLGKTAMSSLSSESSSIEAHKAIIRECKVDPTPFRDLQVIGLDQAMYYIRRGILIPLQQAVHFQGTLQGPKALLLVGPPGCGKTTIMQALAVEVQKLNVSVFFVSAAQLLDKYLGESQKRIRALFEVAWEQAPSIIYMDEFDAIFGASPNRKTDGSSEATLTSIQIQKELLHYIGGFQAPPGKPTLLVAASNNPEMILPAQLRRFTLALYIPPPTRSAIRQFLDYLLAHTKHTLTDADLHLLSLKFKSYTPDEIKKVVELAYLSTFELDSIAPPRPLTRADIDACLPIIYPMLLARKHDKTVGTMYFRKWSQANGRPHIRYRLEPWEEDEYDPASDIELQAVGLVPDVNYRTDLRFKDEGSFDVSDQRW